MPGYSIVVFWTTAVALLAGAVIAFLVGAAQGLTTAVLSAFVLFALTTAAYLLAWYPEQPRRPRAG